MVAACLKMVERVFLVRHAETAANALDLVQGAFDSELTENDALRLGKKVSQAMGKRFLQLKKV